MDEPTSQPDTANVRLELSELCAGLPRLTSAMGTALAEAATVCLSENGHNRNVALSVEGMQVTVYRLSCLEMTEAMRATYHDLQEATEWGACGIAILLISRLTDYQVVKRSAKGTGIDYWLGRKDDPLFQEAARLEVSGILVGDSATIRQRVRTKLEQVDLSASSAMTAFVIVIEFSRPMAQVERK